MTTTPTTVPACGKTSVYRQHDVRAEQISCGHRAELNDGSPYIWGPEGATVKTSEEAMTEIMPEYAHDTKVEISRVDTQQTLDARVINQRVAEADAAETTGGWTPTAADVLLVQLAHLEGQEPTWSRHLWLHTIEKTMGLWADAVRSGWRESAS